MGHFERIAAGNIADHSKILAVLGFSDLHWTAQLVI